MILRPWVIVLAAGGSRRFGGPKLLARVGGESLLRRAVRAGLGCRPAGCVVVLGARAPELARELRGYPVRIAINRRWQNGLSGSIRAGIAALPREAAAALLLLADQPAIGPAELELLAAAWRRRPSAVVASRFDDTLGAPALFPRRWFAALRRLRGDKGARRLLVAHRRQVVGIELAAAGFDVDAPVDLRVARSERVLS